jgi:adenylate kinase
MDKKANIILLGPPGAGKGTLAEVLARELDMIHLSSGDIFRQEMAAKTELGVKISEMVKSGKLVCDDLTLGVVLEHIKDVRKGVLFDGFPRTLPQAKGLDDFLKSTDKKITAVVFIDLSEDEILKRLSLRKTCGNCKAVYNLVSKPPRKKGVCDKCGGKLILREDDKPQTIKKRLAVFNEQTAPLIDYYRANHKFYKVAGVGTPDEVSGRVLKVLGVEVV